MDREKIIKGLEFCTTHYNCRQKASTCPYIELCKPIENATGNTLMRDALAMLKEQEAVEPKQVDLYGNDEWWGLVCVCTDCNAEWMTDKANTHFCPNCGRPVKWE